MAASKVKLGGVARVYCVHDREKRQVVTETQVAELGLSVGRVYDPGIHKLHLCTCCENLFVEPTDTPRLCERCLQVPVHPLGGPLPEPRGVI